jgi:hypothetical protein
MSEKALQEASDPGTPTERLDALVWLSEPNIAMFIKNKLESALGIKDRSIS